MFRKRNNYVHKNDSIISNNYRYKSLIWLFTQPCNCMGNLNYYSKIKLLISNLLTELINDIEDIRTWVTGVGEEGSVDIKPQR